MAYRSLLVHLDADARLDVRVRAAAKLAVAHEAHVMGLAVGAPESTAALVRPFHQRMSELHVRSSDAREEDGEPAELLARHGAHCDLAVLAASSSGIDVDGLAGAFFLNSGRPALILPEEGEVEDIGQRVVVAWNGTREANRAIADALPLLCRAQYVEVVCFDKADKALFSRLELNDLRAWLRRHGVEAVVTQHPAQWSVAEALSSWVANGRCDLLVMGSYSHGHLRESVLGGVTRSMLATTPVPLLVSH